MHDKIQFTKEDLEKIRFGFSHTLGSFHCYFFSNPDFDKSILYEILDTEIQDLISCKGHSFYQEKEFSDHPDDKIQIHNGVELIVGPVQTPCG